MKETGQLIQQPVIETERLLLRPLREEDDTAVFILRSDKEVNRYLGRTPVTVIEEAREFIKKIGDSVQQGKSCYWAICFSANAELIGTICIWNLSADGKTGEVGYELHPAHQGKGVMNEALKAVIDFAFHKKGIEMLEAYTHKDNLASTRLLVKNGFLLQPDRKDPEIEDLTIYTLDRK